MSHHHHHAPAASWLRTAFFLTLAILLVEAVAGFAANSLALISDAGHILTDAFALGAAWFAARLAGQPPDTRNTFGYRRTTILAAFVNAGLLLLIAVAVIVEASLRLGRPEHVDAIPVVAAALLAIAVNALIVTRLQGDDDLNVRAVFLHVVGDMAASLGVVVAGLVILVWHQNLADPLISIGIAALIGYGAWRIVRDAATILMEGTPRGVDLGRITDAMREVPGVEDVHDLHVWALSDGFFLLSAHVAVPDQRLSDTANLLTNLKTMLRSRFKIEHATIEVECLDCRVPQRQPIHLEGTGSPASRPRLNAPRAGPPSGIRRPTEHQGSVGPTEAKGRG